MSNSRDSEESARPRNPLCSQDLLIHQEYCPPYNLPWAICCFPFTENMPETLTLKIYSVEKPRVGGAPVACPTYLHWILQDLKAKYSNLLGGL